MNRLEGISARLCGSDNAELRRLADLFGENVSAIIRRGVKAEIRKMQKKEQQTV